MSGNTTQNTTPPGYERSAGPEAEVIALVVADCAAEPWRIGETILFPELGVDTILGRGNGDGRAPRAELLRQRPTGNALQPGLADDTISRDALRLVARADYTGAVVIHAKLHENTTKRRELRRNGVPCADALLRPGDTLQLRGATDCKLVLLCTMRPRELRTQYPHVGTWPVFGLTDEHGFVGESPARWQLRDALIFAALAGSHTLLHGPSGAGKELAARALHAWSRRAAGPFVARSAANFVETLIDSQLFGNAANYPNPPAPARPGLFGEADGGTLFLDEIGELAPWLQAKLLRVTDPACEYARLGESHARRCDVWVIGATNRETASLKHDFAARLKRVVELPGLDQRREDIPLLAQHLALTFFQHYPEIADRFVYVDGIGRRRARIDPALIDVLVRWPYTTHARELESLLVDQISQSWGQIIELTPVLERKLQARLQALQSPAGRVEPPAPSRPDAEQERVLRALCDGTHGSKARAARALGISRQKVDRRLARYGIVVPDDDGSDGK